MGDSPPGTKQQTRDLLRYLAQYAPETIEAISETLPGTSGAQLAAERAVAPGYQDLYRANQLAGAGVEADVVEGPGGRLVSAADKYQRELDPEFYAQRAMLSGALDKFLGGYDPYRLSPTEEAGIARGINAATGPVSPSNLNTVRNAMVFGEAGNKRWQNFGDAITKAASAIPVLRSGISGFDVARTRGFDTGARGAVEGALGTNFGFSSSALGNVTSASNAALAKKKDIWDQILAGTQALSNVASSAGSLGFGV